MVLLLLPINQHTIEQYRLTGGYIKETGYFQGMITKLLYIQPSELKFPFQLNKLSTCWLQLTNRTDQHVAFKVKTTHPRKYCVRPNVGIVSPGSTCVIRVGMQAQKVVLQPALLKDKFLIQSVIVPAGLNVEDITSEMFRKERGNGLEEQKLRVVYVTANPPSPIPEGSEEECSPEASELEKAEHENRINTFLNYALASTSGFQDQFSKASDSGSEPEEQRNEDWDTVSKLIEERSLAFLENKELQHELEMVRKQINRRICSAKVSILIVLLACLLGFVFGYVIK